jgi:hypothetical protein
MLARMINVRMPRQGKPGDLGGGFSGTFDESFPTERVHAAIAKHKIAVDAEAFDEFLGHRLGRYRFVSDVRKSAPAVGEELSQIAKLISSIEKVRAGFANLPPRAGPLMDEFHWKRSNGAELFFQLWQRTEAHLKDVRMLLLFAERELRECTSNAGRPNAGPRDSLLHDVAERLLCDGAPSMHAAAVCAADVLRACDVPVPNDDAELEAERIVRKQRKLRSDGGKIAPK